MRRHRLGLALLAAVLAGGVPAGCVVAASHPMVTATGATASPPENATLGTSATRDGVFAYTVNSLDCDATANGVRPRGRYCAVSVTVRNLSADPRTPGIAFAQALDDQGSDHLADMVAQFRTEEPGSSLFTDLAPGADVTARLFYDVPPSARLTSVLLRETPSSAGVRVTF